MNDAILGKKVASLTALAAFLITILMTAGLNSDPINLPKMFLLVIFASVTLGVIAPYLKKWFKTNKPIALTLVTFLFGLLISTLYSSSPWVQNIYGASGRNTGVLTYISLMVFFIAGTFIKDIDQAYSIFKGLFAAFTFNAVYGIFQITNHDPIKWTNPYNSFLGTLGNPNFSAAFMAIGVTSALPIFLWKVQRKIYKIAGFALILIGIYEIQSSNALQGKVVLAFGILVTILYYLINKQISTKIIASYLSIVITVITVSILGMLQIGPLKEFLFKSTVTLRGFYWRAGLEMFQSKPIYGVGFDSYGDYYTRVRGISAIKSPGAITTVSNSAHNVLIDILASGGILVTVPYLILNFIALSLVIKRIISKAKVDSVEQSLVIAWLGYSVQSIVSINQIGLAIWGWILPGAIIGISKMSNDSTGDNLKKINKSRTNNNSLLNPTSYLMGAIFGFIGLMVVLPAQVADTSWRAATDSRSVDGVLNSAKKFPMSSARLSQSSIALLKSGYPEQALELAKIAIEFNKDDYNSWISYISNPLISEIEKNNAKKNLSRIDPLDKRWLS